MDLEAPMSWKKVMFAERAEYHLRTQHEPSVFLKATVCLYGYHYGDVTVEMESTFRGLNLHLRFRDQSDLGSAKLWLALAFCYLF